jgi:hypothetical protein
MEKLTVLSMWFICKGQMDIPVGSRVTQIAVSGSGLVIYTDDGRALVTESDNSSIVTEGNGPGPYLNTSMAS